VDYIAVQFGRTGEDSFALDVQFPVTPLQALLLALSACEAHP
jgi:hypothetical protein